MKNAHPLQAKEWGDFREKTGVKVIRTNNLQLTIHPIPHTNYTIGYLPKGPFPTKQMLDVLKQIGKTEKCVLIQLEPNAEKINNLKSAIENLGLIPAAHPLFTPYTFILDLTKSEEELLKNMHPKTRYNIRVAEKKGVKIAEDNSSEAFEVYLKLTKETTTRQNFYAHSENYHRLMWETLKPADGKWQMANGDSLTAHLLTATYENKVLVAWILFVLGDTLYYPYGSSSNEHREVMASNLMMWEAIKFGKRLGLKHFDMWGALGPNPNTKDPWYGFHRFKEGYGGKLVESLGSYDLVIDKKMYLVYKLLNKLRWIILRFK
jgi:lipid II:glycine glycyltransferase (peptidoglycan interpeptide bridge formation enzyme)